MGRRLSMATRAELLEGVRERYGKARPPERRLILDEFVAVSGYHRKHAIRLLRQPGGSPAPDRRGRSPVYDAAVRAALLVVWEASDRICGKRLKAALPVLVPAMERHGHLSLDEVVRSRLLAVSASTIDRLLRDVRARAGAGRRRSGATSAVRRGVRVRTFGDWGEPPPGFTEVDLVAHSGPSMAGAFAWTLVLTDVATGWTECVPLPCRDGALVVEALTRLRGVLPFPLGGADFDNDSVFMNEDVVGWCRGNGIEVTRSRAYRKNDQAWVEQKNGAVVRRLVGHDRLEGLAATGELGRLYASARLLVNFFQPSFKLAAKRRDGAKVSRRYHAPATPYARLLATGKLEPGVGERLAAEFAALDPIALLAAIRGSQERPPGPGGGGGGGRTPRPAPPRGGGGAPSGGRPPPAGGGGRGAPPRPAPGARHRLAGGRGPGHAPREAEGPALLALARRPVRGGRGEPALLAGGRAGPAGHRPAGEARGGVPRPVPRQAPSHAATSRPRVAAGDRPPPRLRPRGAASVGRGCRHA